MQDGHVRISHVSCGVSDVHDAEQRLRELGLGLWRFPREVGAHLPLADHQYVELYGPSHPLWRRGWIAWSIAVDVFEDDVERLGLTDVRPFGDDPERTFTPWRGRLAGTTSSRASGGVVPYLIAYDETVDLEAIFSAKHDRARHDVRVGPLREINTDGREIRSVVIEIDGSDVPLPLP